MIRVWYNKGHLYQSDAWVVEDVDHRQQYTVAAVSVVGSEVEFKFDPDRCPNGWAEVHGKLIFVNDRVEIFGGQE